MPDTLLLNLGCGKRIHPAWRNLDFAPRVDGVTHHDLRHPLPFPDSSVDGCYCSHVIGHLPDSAAKQLLAEIHRVLKPGGIARFVVPDLQQIIANYQALIGPLLQGDRKREADYDWTMIELYDQVARSHSGGRMAEYLSQEKIPNAGFAVERMGEEVRTLMERGLHDGTRRPPLSEILADPPLRASYIAKLRNKIAGYLVLLAGGRGALQAFQHGLFRCFSGEVQWRVYDRFSLTRRLENAGFADVIPQAADKSQLPDFATYHLDTDENGSPRKPESLYLEASTPSLKHA